MEKELLHLNEIYNNKTLRIGIAVGDDMDKPPLLHFINGLVTNESSKEIINSIYEMKLRRYLSTNIIRYDSCNNELKTIMIEEAKNNFINKTEIK